DPDGAVAFRAWDLNGDGVFAEGTDATATTTFAAAGTYTVRLQVTDNLGAASVATRQVTSTGPPPPDQPPPASFSVSPTSPIPGQAVTLTDTSTDPDGTVASRAWDLNGDGVYAEGTGTTATTSFPAPGTYTVGLRVTDDQGVSADTTRQVLVAQAPAGNLIANSSFEAGVTGWRGLSATVAQQALPDAPDGTKVAL